MAGRRHTNPTTQAAKAIHAIVKRGSIQDPLYGGGRIEVLKTLHHNGRNSKLFYFRYGGEDFACLIEKR